MSYGEIPLETINSLVKGKFGVDFEEILKEWNSKNVPTFRTKNIKIERVELNGRHCGFIARFQVHNAGDIPGTIIYGPSSGSDENGNHCLVLQPGACKQVRWKTNGINAAYVSLGISQNIPSQIEMNFEQYDNILRKENNETTQDTVCGVWDIPLSQFDNPMEIVVDNEDVGFRLIAPNDDKLLRRL